MVHHSPLARSLLLTFFLLGHMAFAGCAVTTRLGVVSAMDRNNDLGINGTFALGGGLRDGKNALVVTSKGSAGMDPVNSEPVGTVVGGIEYIRYRKKTGFRFGLYGGPSFSNGEVGTRLEANVGIFEYFPGKYGKLGGLALDMSVGYVPGELSFSGFWYGVGLSWQFDLFYNRD